MVKNYLALALYILLIIIVPIIFNILSLSYSFTHLNYEWAKGKMIFSTIFLILGFCINMYLLYFSINERRALSPKLIITLFQTRLIQLIILGVLLGLTLFFFISQVTYLAPSDANIKKTEDEKKKK